MKFYILNLVILTFNIFFAPAINGFFPFGDREVETNTGSNPDTEEQLSGSTIFVQNVAKGETITTVAYIMNGIEEAQSARLRAGEMTQFLIPAVAKNAIIKIEEWIDSPTEVVPYTKLLMMDNRFNPSSLKEKCFKISGVQNNMKASEMPCPAKKFSN